MMGLFQWQNKKTQFLPCRLLASGLRWHDGMAERCARLLKQSEFEKKLNIN